jgi:hypothetical protein
MHIRLLVCSLDFKKTALNFFITVDPFRNTIMHNIKHSPGVSISIDDKLYYYDSESDCYYRHREPTTWDAYGWLIVILALAAIALYFEFWPIR